MKTLLKNILKDKTGAYSMREMVIALCMVLMVVSWGAQVFFNIPTPEYMFYALVSLIATGCFGYSLEKKDPPVNEKSITSKHPKP